MILPADVFPLLLGRWHLERSIPGHATMRGEARVTLDNDKTSALYAEHVHIHTETGHQLTGNARYTFTPVEDGTLNVYLATGTLFHTLRFTRSSAGILIARATHLCISDRYTSVYTLSSPHRLTIEHHVTGPAKHYTITTHLIRQPARGIDRSPTSSTSADR